MPLGLIWTMVLCLLFFILYYLYLWQVVDLRLIYHEGGISWDFPVFYTGWEFFRKFITYPGGLVSYVSAFLAQFFYIGWAGPVVATAQAWLLWLCTGVIMRAAGGRRIGWVCFTGPILLLIIYARYTYPFANERYVYPFNIAMDLLTILGFSYLYMAATSKAKPVNLVIFAVLSIIVYVVGGGEYLLFSVICGLYELFFRRRAATALVFLIAPPIVAYLASEFFFDAGITDAFNGFMPHFFGGDKLTLTVVYALYFLLPLGLLGLWIAGLLRKGERTAPARPLKTIGKTGRGRLERLRMRLAGESAAAITPVLAIIAGVLVICFCHNTKAKAFIAVNYYVNRGMWNKALETARPYQHNKFISHAINLALYQTGRLGEDMFEYDQVRGALTLSGESETPMGRWWSFDTYIEMGHMNIAESMLALSMDTFGERPIVLRRLALVSMVKGDTGAAKVYLGALSRTLFDAGWAKDYLEKIELDPNLSTDREIQRLRGLMPETDREFNSLNENLFLDLLEKNRGNRMAFEYLTAYYLLTGQLDDFAGIIVRLDDFGYKFIPRSYEEAILLYNFMTKKNKIELPGSEIGREATQRFKGFNDIYLGRYRSNKKLAFNELAGNYGDSYFFYYVYGISGLKQ